MASNLVDEQALAMVDAAPLLAEIMAADVDEATPPHAAATKPAPREAEAAAKRSLSFQEVVQATPVLRRVESADDCAAALTVQRYFHSQQRRGLFRKAARSVGSLFCHPRP